MSRIQFEKRSLLMMIDLFCRDMHKKSELCEECSELAAYSLSRLDSCPFGEKKRACSKCTIHCYRKDMRVKIIRVMRYSGPRMIYRHPIAAIRHMIGF